MADEEANRAAFTAQARWCRQMTAPITGRIVAASGRAINRSTATGRTVLDWPGDPVADALALRLVGGLHALHRAGRDPALSRAFAGDLTRTGLVVAAVRDALATHDAVLLPWLAGPPQTNEVARSAALMTGLLHLARRLGRRIELLEVGSSAGLNLLIGCYGIDLGGVRVGPDAPAMTLAPTWRGPAPPSGPVKIMAARGVDFAPVNLADAAEAERLQAWVWVDAVERQERLATAIGLVRAQGVRLERGDAADWLAARLGEPQADGVVRVLVHSVVWQYLPPATRERIVALMVEAGRSATDRRPLGWAMMEPDPDHADHLVRVRGWPGDTGFETVASAHPHAAWLEGLAGPA